MIEETKVYKIQLTIHNMKPVINRADIIGGLKSVKLARNNPQNYQPGVGVSEDFKLLSNFK